jgi:type VI secretion system secreted protein Hcp
MAAVDMFLKLVGAEGESKDSEKAGQFQIQGFKLNARSPHDASTGGATGKIRFTDLTIYTNVERGTAKLFDMIGKNQKIPKAELTCRKAGKDPFVFLKITLSDCFLSRVEIGTGGSEGGDAIPPCEFDIDFGKIDVMSMEQTEKGPTSGQVCASIDLRSRN